MLAKQLLRRDGKGPIARDPPRALALLEKGCSYNHGPSCYNLTVMLKKGDEGVPRCVLAVPLRLLLPMPPSLYYCQHVSASVVPPPAGWKGAYLRLLVD
ncbi:unnamed protein product [Scytosiphon promiscuus]